MAEFDMRPLSLGEQLDRAFTVFRHRFGALLISAVACMAIPMIMVANNLKRWTDLTAAAQGGGSREALVQQMMAMMGKLAWVALVALAGLVVARAAIAWITHKALLGDRADAFEGLEKGVRFFPAMLGLAIVEGGIYLVVAGALYLPAVLFFAGSMASGGGSGAVLGIVGVIAAIVVVMFWVVSGFFVTSAVLVCETDAAVFSSLGRSWSLTKGHRGPIIGGMLVIAVVAFVVQFVLMMGVGVFFAGRMQADPAAAQGPVMLVGFGLNAVMNLLVTTFFYVFQMVTYYDLRIRKEGLDLEITAERMKPV